MPDPKVSTVRMPDSKKSDLAAIARSHDMSVADAIREALEQYIVARRSEEEFKERWRGAWRRTARCLTAWGKGGLELLGVI